MRAGKRNFRGTVKAPSDLETESVDSYAELEDNGKRENRVRNGVNGVSEVNEGKGVRRVRSRRGSRAGSVKGEEEKGKDDEKKGKEKEEEEEGREKEGAGVKEGDNENDPFGSVVFFSVNVAPKTTNGKVTLFKMSSDGRSDIIIQFDRICRYSV